MYRVALAILTLTCASIVHANTLYKWTEADGSITFSTTKPPASVEYETIDRAKKAMPEQLDKALLQSLPRAPAPQPKAHIERSRNNSTPQTGAALPTTPLPAIRASGEPRIEHGSNSNNRRSPQQGSDLASSNKQGHCNDLKKRVLSLESRLPNTLTDEDMDNTVVHMARYQASYDQYCD